MGAENVAWVLTRASPALGDHHRTKVALAVMALVALDHDTIGPAGDPLPARTYFGGWRPIAHALGLKGTPETQAQAVSRALKVARDLGLVEVVTRAQKGRSTTVFRLVFEAIPLACDTQVPQVPLAHHTQVPLAHDTQVPLACDTQAEEEGGGSDDSKSAPRERRKPASPLPDDWMPNGKHREFAASRDVDVDHEADQLRAHALANDRRQADWDAAFRTWLGNARSTLRRATSRGPGSARDFGESRVLVEW